MIKKIAAGLAVLIVLAGLALAYVWTNLDHYIKVAIEKYGTAATQTEVSLDSVKLSLSTGEGSLSGLKVANPKGFSSVSAFNLGLISVAVDPGSLPGKGPIVIKQIVIEKPQVEFELANNGTTNLQTIQRNAQNYAAMAGNAGGHHVRPDTPAMKEGTNGQGRKIIINDLTIRDGQVAVTQESLQGKQFSTALPTIHLTDVGKASGGATAAQIAQQLISSISGAAAQAGLTELAKQKLSGALKEVPGAAIGGAAVDQVGTSIKGLLGQ